MKIGKLPNSMLEKIIIDPIVHNSVKRSEVLLRPSVGEDCSALDMGENICLISTDPITGAAEDIGRLAVLINTNDISASGGEPIGMTVTALLPPDVTESEISKIITDLCEEAKRTNIVILGGHTEITDAVTKPVLSCTVIGRTKKIIPSGGAKTGDSLIMTKYAGLEGTAIFAKDKAHKLKGVDRDIIERARALGEQLSVIKEGKIAAAMGAHAMHDITEGGVLGACWEIAESAGLGVTVYCDKIPVLEETKIICAELGTDPLRLISSGSMLIACDDPGKMTDALSKEGINSAVIGTITPKERSIIAGGTVLPLKEPDTDELYKV